MHRRDWSESQGEFVSTGEVLGYEALGPSGKVLGRGETVADAIEEALKATWVPPGRPSVA